MIRRDLLAVLPVSSMPPTRGRVSPPQMLSNLLIIFYIQLLEVCGVLMFDTAADACIGQNQTKKNPDVSVHLVRFFLLAF